MSNKRKQTDNRIALYSSRTLSDVLNATIDFVRVNRRIMFRYMLTIIMPVCIVQSVGLNTIADNWNVDLAEDITVTINLTILVGVVGFVLLNALLWTLIRMNHLRPEGLSDLESREFWPTFRRMLRRYARAFVPMVIMAIPMTLLGIIPMFVTFGFGFFFVLTALIPVLLVGVIYCIEDVSLLTAVKRGFTVTWRMGDLIGLTITLIIIIIVIAIVTTLPWSLFIFFKDTLLTTPDTAIVTAVSKIVSGLFSVLACMGSYLSITVLLLSIAYLYGSLDNLNNDMRLSAEIDNFENL